MKILAIESSCDETSAAVVEKQGDNVKVLSNVTATSLATHAKTGGIIPENAAREQVKYIIPVITKALNESRSMKHESWEEARKILDEDIDSFAVTHGPGLIGSLLVGVETAKTLSLSFNKPLIPVNHLLAHLFANFIVTANNSQLTSNKNAVSSQKLEVRSYPFIGLIVSGGHTDLLFFESIEKFTWLGGTRDDAAGEALDKIGRLLGLSYPAGPEIEKRAKVAVDTKQDVPGTSPVVRFKSPLLENDTFDFSFSGLKTEAMRLARDDVILNSIQDPKGIADQVRNDRINEVCFAVQKAVIDVLVRKTLKAAEKYNCPTILLGGGVSANQTLIDKMNQEARIMNQDFRIFSPEKIYCTDNAAMIGAYALLNPKIKPYSKVRATPDLYFA